MLQARITDDRVHRGLSTAITLVGAFGALVLLTSFNAGSFPHARETLGVLLALWCLGPALAHPARWRRVRIALGANGITLGRRKIAATDTTGASIARGELGWSVVIETAPRSYVLELSTAREAAAVLHALGQASHALAASVRVRARGRTRAMRVIALVGVLAGLGYARYADTPQALPGVENAKGVFGFGALGAAALQSVLVLLALRRSRLRWARGELRAGNTRLALGPAVAVDRAGTLRLGAPPAERRIPLGALGAHIALHVRAALAEPAAAAEIPAATGVRVALGEGESTVRWLARLDALAAGADYRRDAPDAETLWSVLRDRGAEIDARLGAARVLHTVHGVPVERVTEAVEPVELRARVQRVLEHDVETAANAIERLGPAFRAG